MSARQEDVWPPGHDLSAFHRMWDRPKARRSAIVLDIKCPKGHFVSAVYRLATDYIYVADVSYALDDRPVAFNAGRLRLFGRGTRLVTVDGPRGETPHGRHIEFLRAVERWELGPVPMHPAECPCGPRTIDRESLLGWIDSGEPHVVLD